MPSDAVYVLTGLVTLIVLVTVAALVIRHFWQSMTYQPKADATQAKPERKMWFLLKGPRCDYCGCMNRPNEIKCIFCGAPLKAEGV